MVCYLRLSNINSITQSLLQQLTQGNRSPFLVFTSQSAYECFVAVDTVAAGDAFNGGLAAALYEGLSLPEAVVWGAAAGVIACTKPGAQSAMGDRHQLNALLQPRHDRE